MKFYLIFTGLILFHLNLFSQSLIEASIDTKNILAEIPETFIGLSFEMEKVLPDQNGKYFFSPSNKPLISTFKTLGIKSLRVGGNTADRPSVKIPNKQDIDSLFEFVKSAGVKVIYTLRLNEGDPDKASEIVKYIMDNYSSLVDCFAIGNEPNVFAKEYSAYRDEWKGYVEIIKKKSPNAKYCGPSSTPGKAGWSKNFANDFANSSLIKFISQHAYPGGSGRIVTNPEFGREEMLSSDWIKSYQKFYYSFVPEVESKGFSYRIEETNNFFNGGAKDVSNTFASALWGLDYMFWWASHKAIGINFHTGDLVAAGEINSTCYYAVFLTSPFGYSIRPIGYAIKAFDLAGNGKMLPVNIHSNKEKINVEIYSTISDDKNIFITVINKETGSDGRDVEINFNLNNEIVNGETIFLTSPGRDIAATSGIKLGNFEISEETGWNGSWNPINVSIKNGKFILKIPAATAAIIKLVMR